MTEEPQNTEEDLISAELAFQAAIHSELFSTTNRAERDRMLTVAILSLGFVFLGVASPDVNLGPFKFGKGEWWVLPLGLSLVTAYFIGSFIISGLLDRKLWFVRGAPLSRSRLKAIIQSMSAVDTDRKAFFKDNQDLLDKQQQLRKASDAVLEAQTQRLRLLQNRADKGEVYDLSELDDETDPHVVDLKKRRQALKIDFELAAAQFFAQWPKERLQKSSPWKGGGYNWTRPYWFQMGWIFTVPIAVAILAEVALFGAISRLRNDMSRDGEPSLQQALACSVAAVPERQSEKNQILALTCVNFPVKQPRPTPQRDEE